MIKLTTAGSRNLYKNLTKAENSAAHLGQISHHLTQIGYENGRIMIKKLQCADLNCAQDFE